MKMCNFQNSSWETIGLDTTVVDVDLDFSKITKYLYYYLINIRVEFIYIFDYIYYFMRIELWRLWEGVLVRF